MMTPGCGQCSGCSGCSNGPVLPGYGPYGPAVYGMGSFAPDTVPTVQQDMFKYGLIGVGVLVAYYAIKGIGKK